MTVVEVLAVVGVDYVLYEAEIVLKVVVILGLLKLLGDGEVSDSQGEEAEAKVSGHTK